MAGFAERLSAIKEKQDAADLKKKQNAEQAVEVARLSREAKRSELAAERDAIFAEFTQAEKTADEAREAIAQAGAFAVEQGENLDPEAKAEIDAMKVEAGEAQQQFEELKTRLDGLNTEISAFEESAETQEVPSEPIIETVSTNRDEIAHIGKGSPKNRLVPPEEFTEIVEGQRKEAYNRYSAFSFIVEGKAITVNMGEVDSLDGETKEKLLDDLRKKNYQTSGEKLSSLLEARLISSSEISASVLERFKGYITQNFSAQAITELKKDRELAHFISEETKENADYVARKVKEGRPDEAVAQFAKMLRAGIKDDLDLRSIIIQKGQSNFDGRAILDAKFKRVATLKRPVTDNIFTPQDLGAYVQAGYITTEQFKQLVKNNMDYYKDKNARFLMDGINEVLIYQRMGLITPEEADRLLSYD